MPEVKASPATPDKSLSHSRYSLATRRDLENSRLGGTSVRARSVGLCMRGISSLQDALSKQEEL